jgi:hypothetical protein
MKKCGRGRASKWVRCERAGTWLGGMAGTAGDWSGLGQDAVIHNGKSSVGRPAHNNGMEGGQFTA